MENNVPNPEQDQEDNLDDEKQALTGYAKYTGVAFQMMAIIGAFAFIGYKTDQYFGHKTQWVTAIACLIGVCFSIYNTIRQLKS